MSVFGFSTEPSKGGDFTPICKYDARAGRFFRIDRAQLADGNYANEIIDITQSFKAIFDFENVEVGWLDFPPGGAPSMVLSRMGQKLPDKPSERHKNGLRMLIKLSKDCGGAKPIREIAGTSKAFLSGIEAAYLQYEREKASHPGTLPVLALEKTTPVTTGSGQKSSTNYHPTFKLVGWVPRGDLVFVAKGQEQQVAQGNGQAAQGSGAAPSTGSVRATPPPQTASVSAEDFG